VNILELKRFIESAAPSERLSLLRLLDPTLADMRRESLKSIPRIPLREENVSSCQALLNRKALLTHLPRGGVCAGNRPLG